MRCRKCLPAISLPVLAASSVVEIVMDQPVCVSINASAYTNTAYYDGHPTVDSYACDHVCRFTTKLKEVLCEELPYVWN